MGLAGNTGDRWFVYEPTRTESASYQFARVPPDTLRLPKASSSGAGDGRRRYKHPPQRGEQGDESRFPRDHGHSFRLFVEVGYPEASKCSASGDCALQAARALKESGGGQSAPRKLAGSEQGGRFSMGEPEARLGSKARQPARQRDFALGLCNELNDGPHGGLRNVRS